MVFGPRNSDLKKVRAIDRRDCTCNECMTGWHVPMRSHKTTEVLRHAYLGEMETELTCGIPQSSIITYEKSDGQFQWRLLEGLTKDSAYCIIAPESSEAIEGDDDWGLFPVVDAAHLDSTPTDVLRPVLGDLLEGRPWLNRSKSAYIVFETRSGDDMRELSDVRPGKIEIVWN